MDPAKAARSERITELDALRGIAAASVVLFHFTTEYARLYGPAGPLLAEFPRGQYGVHLFFMLSGFVILMTLERTRRGSHFAVSRFARLYPGFWVAVLLTFAVIRVAGLPGQERTLPELAANLTMIPAWLGSRYVDGVYWSLSYELVFYAVMFGVYRAGWLRRIEAFSLAWIGLSVATAAAVRAGVHVPGAVLTLLLLQWAHLFSLGMAYYRARTAGWTPLRVVVAVSALGAEAVIHTPESALVAAGLALLFYVGVFLKPAVLRSRVLVFFGTISYALYLVHQNVGYVVIHRLRALGLEANLAVAAACLVSVGLAAALAFWVERPAQARIMGWYRSREARPAPAPGEAVALS